MLKLLLTLAFVFLVCSELTAVAQSDSSILIIGGVNYSSTATTYLNANEPTLIPGATWIWNSQGDDSPAGTRLTFNKLFYLSCNGSLTLSIAAFGSWQLWWDGYNVQNGANWQTAIQIPLSWACGSHNLTIVVTKTSSQSIAGLAFSLGQDQSNCHNCAANGFWNQKTCACQCISPSCGCASNRQWKDYPTCGCGCPSRVISSPAVAASGIFLTRAMLPIIRFRMCPSGQYYSQVACKCLCNEQYCPGRNSFVNDPALKCGCVPIIY